MTLYPPYQETVHIHGVLIRSTHLYNRLYLAFLRNSDPPLTYLYFYLFAYLFHTYLYYINISKSNKQQRRVFCLIPFFSHLFIFHFQGKYLHYTATGVRYQSCMSNHLFNKFLVYILQYIF